MAKQQADEHYSADETAKRRDDAIRRALSTPPIPLKKFVGKSSLTGGPKKPRKAKAQAR